MERKHTNESDVIVIRPKINYTQVPNSLIENKELSLEERLFLIFVSSKHEGFTFYKCNLHHLLGIKEGTLDRIWKSLTTKGHITSNRIRNKKTGSFDGWQHTIIIELSQGQDSPTQANACLGEHGDYSNTNLSSKS
jgi:hypothetical protein